MYCVLSTIFAAIIFATFFLFPSGGEAARARALGMGILHGFFAGWGMLLWAHISPPCVTVISEQYGTLLAFHHMSVVNHIIFFILVSAHELFLGSFLGADLTLMSEIKSTPLAEELSPGLGYPQDIDIFGFSGSPNTQGTSLVYHHVPTIDKLSPTTAMNASKNQGRVTAERPPSPREQTLPVQFEGPMQGSSIKIVVEEPGTRSGEQRVVSPLGTPVGAGNTVISNNVLAPPRGGARRVSV